MKMFFQKILSIGFAVGLLFTLSFNSVIASVKDEVLVVISKVDEAVKLASTKKDASIPEFQNDKKWNWESSYIFVINCKTTITLAHPMVPSLVGKPTAELKDKKGNLFFKKFCEVAQNPKGGWVEYWWPNPQTKNVERKISVTKQAPGTDIFVGAGVYDDKSELKLEELDKMLK
ncbi:MAG: cache domain-containing protein [Oligoflexia bacterium]|nr:cache domain-containing protein [Oligoflexia bacterium]